MEGTLKKILTDKEKEKTDKTTEKKIPSIKIDFTSEKEDQNILTKNTLIKEENEIKKILNKIALYYNNISLNKNNNNNKNIISFECPEEKCPYIPLLKYYEYTQTVSSICRKGHQYHISLCDYFEKILNNLNTEKHCQICLKKNLMNNKSTPEFYCINCTFFLCKNCKMKHYSSHKVYELNKINTVCPLHEKNKFSGFCRACKKDICIHCLKDHANGNGHHSLVQYMNILPSKEKIDKYKKQIKDEFNYIEKLKNIFLEENIIKDENIRTTLDEFFDRMKLKYYFYDIQLQTYDKIKFNINIIKNVTDLFLVRQQTFEGIYIPIELNLSEKKLEILNRILFIVLKYQIKDKKNDNNLLNINIKSYLSHFKFNHIYSLTTKKSIKFLYLLKNGKFLICTDNDGLYLYDDSTYKELLHIPSEIDIIDLCENDSGLIFLLKKSMIEIIRLEENNMSYFTENKILFKYIDQVNFITCLNNGTIIVSRTKRTEGNLDIWMKSKNNNSEENNDNNSGGNNDNSNNNNDNRRHIFFAPDRRRNMFNMVNNNLRLGLMLRTARHNVNNFYQNNIINNLANNQINNLILNPNNNNNANGNVNANGNINNNENNNNENNDENDDDDDDNDDVDNNDDENNNNNNDNQNNNNNENNNNNQNNENNNETQLNQVQNNNNINNNNNTINNNNDIINNNNDINSINNNDNILLEEMPGIIPNLDINNNNNNNSNINNINNNNNNNLNNQNLILPNIHQININTNTINNINNNNNRINNRLRNRPQRQRPRFVHVIRFIRDQLQGLVHNLEQEELVLEDPSLISSVGIYGSKDNEITHINKPLKKGCEIISLIDWDEDYFICAEFFIGERGFRGIKIYSKENYEPIKKKSKLKINYCLKDKKCLIKINEDLLGVCYTKEEIEYGISLVSFKTREEVTRYELPKFNLAKNILINNSNFIFVFCKELFDKDDNVIKVLKIEDKELIHSSNYIYEEFLNTFVFNNNNDNIKEKNKEKNNNNLNNINTFNNYDQNDSIDEREMNTVISMVKLFNDTFVCLSKDNTINFYKVE